MDLQQLIQGRSAVGFLPHVPAIFGRVQCVVLSLRARVMEHMLLTIGMDLVSMRYWKIYASVAGHKSLPY